MSISILLFSQYFPPEMGALAARSYEHGLRWVQMGHHVTVICGTPNYPDGKIYKGFRNRLFQRQNVNGIDVIRTWVLPKPNRNAWERITNYTSYFITALLAGFRVRKPDIVIGSSPQLLSGLAGYLVARIRKVPFVLEIRDLWPESIAESGPTDNALLLRVLRWIAHFLYRRADRIVVVADPSKEWLGRIPRVDKEGIRVVPNGIDLALFDSENCEGEDIRREFGLGRKFLVSYIGGIGAAHGIGTVLEAADRLRREPDVTFLLVGDGAEREELQQECMRRRLDNVVFTGKQPREKVVSFLEASDVSLVLLRKREVFKTVIPSKMLESMAMANPIILGVEGEAKRILEEAEAGIAITPENAEELVVAIERLKNDSEFRRELTKNGREYVRQWYDRDKLAAVYVLVLEELVVA